jgi:hypothetical protein
MINSLDFSLGMTKLTQHFGKELSPQQLKDFEEILSEELSTQEFLAAAKIAKKRLQPHPSFFPSPQQMIDSVLGTLEDRANIQLQNLDRLSVVGRHSLEAIGGAFTYRNSEKPDFLRKEFVAKYLTFARNASPDDLRMPSEAAKAIAPAAKETTPQPTKVTLNDKMWMLRCRCNFENQREQAWAEARKCGFKVNMGDVPESERITLSPGQNPNEILQEPAKDFEAGVRSLTSSLASRTLQPLGF